MIFTSGTQKLHGRTVNHDPYPWAYSRRASTIDGPWPNRFATRVDGALLWFPRTRWDVYDNPVLAAFRAYRDHSMNGIMDWLIAMDDPESGTAEVRELLTEAYSAPMGPGWEDWHYMRVSATTEHTRKVLRKLATLHWT